MPHDRLRAYRRRVRYYDLGRHDPRLVYRRSVRRLCLSNSHDHRRVSLQCECHRTGFRLHESHRTWDYPCAPQLTVDHQYAVSNLTMNLQSGDPDLRRSLGRRSTRRIAQSWTHLRT